MISQPVIQLFTVLESVLLICWPLRKVGHYVELRLAALYHEYTAKTDHSLLAVLLRYRMSDTFGEGPFRALTPSNAYPQDGTGQTGRTVEIHHQATISRRTPRADGTASILVDLGVVGGVGYLIEGSIPAEIWCKFRIRS